MANVSARNWQTNICAVLLLIAAAHYRTAGAQSVEEGAGTARLSVQLAFDPNQSEHARVFEFFLTGVFAGDRVEWIIDGSTLSLDQRRIVWTIADGRHEVQALVWRAGRPIAESATFAFIVKRCAPAPTATTRRSIGSGPARQAEHCVPP